MCLSMDNMDNQKCAIGRFAREDKHTDGATSLVTHLTGILMHGRTNAARVYTWYDRFPTGADSVITILLDCLREAETNAPLPPVLYLHMDNCWRENKNKYVVSICNLLVRLGIFEKVKLCFLPVGHTHDDVDQMFSRFSVALQRTDIVTLDGLWDACRASYRPCPEIKHIDSMGAWACWLSPHITQLEGISKPRCFVFRRSNDGVVRHHYRQQLQTSKKTEADCWFPANEAGIDMFPAGVDTLLASPVREVPLKHIDTIELRASLKRISHRLSDSDIGWWNQLLAGFDGDRSESCVKCVELRSELRLNISNHYDDDDLRRSKGRNRYRLLKELRLHMDDLSYNHPVYTNPDSGFGFPRGCYRKDGQCAGDTAAVASEAAILEVCVTYCCSIRMFVYWTVFDR